MAGAKVSIAHLETGLRRETVTGPEGLYRFPLLPLGSFTVSVEAAGFRPTKKTGIGLTAGSTATVDFDLEVGSVATEIVVSDTAAFTEPSRTDFGSTLSGNFVRNLPLVSRNPYNFILVQPNVTGRPNTEFGVPRRVNANGFNNRINYQIDGNNNVQSDRAGIRLIPISNTFVAEVQQVSNGFAAEFGNSVGTVFNTITKSGSNDIHGEAAYIFRRTGFSAAPALLREGAAKPETNVNTFLVDAGGPIKKDRAFFYGAFENVKRDLPQVVTATPAVITQLGLPAEFASPIPFTQNVRFFLGKVDLQLNANHRLTGRFNGHANDSPYNSNAFGLGVITRTYNFVDRSYVNAAQLISTFGSKMVNEFRYQSPLRNQQQLGFEASGPQPAITIPNQILFGGPTAVGFQYRELAPEFSENLSYTEGSHSFKFGVNLRLIRSRQIQANSATYTFPTVQAYLDARNGVNPRGYTNFAQTVGDPRIDYTHKFWSFYGQDSWKPRSNITLSYGLRYDRYLLPTANSNSPLAVSRQFNVDGNNFAPRFGLAIGLGKDRKTVIRAGGGIFYDAPQTDIYRRALLNNGLPTFFSVSVAPTAAIAPSFPNIFTGIPTGFTLGRQDVTAVSPDYRTLYSSNANVSITRELPGAITFTGTYLFTKGTRLPIYRNVNLVPGGSTLADGRPIFGTARIDPNFNNILMAESSGNSNYNGFTATVNKRMGKSLEAFASWTWAHAIDDAPEQNNIDSGAGWLSDISNRRRDRGNSLNDRRHSFNSSMVYTSSTRSGNPVWKALASNNNIALFFLAMSGDVFNMGSNRVLNGDASATTAFQRPLFIGRNTLRGPKTVSLDLRYTRSFPVNERWKPEFFAEFTNLFNRTNVTGLNANATVDAAGAITTPPSLAWTGALDQRLLQFGLRLSF